MKTPGELEAGRKTRQTMSKKSHPNPYKLTTAKDHHRCRRGTREHVSQWALKPEALRRERKVVWSLEPSLRKLPTGCVSVVGNALSQLDGDSDHKVCIITNMNYCQSHAEPWNTSWPIRTENCNSNSYNINTRILNVALLNNMHEYDKWPAYIIINCNSVKWTKTMTSRLLWLSVYKSLKCLVLDFLVLLTCCSELYRRWKMSVRIKSRSPTLLQI